MKPYESNDKSEGGGCCSEVLDEDKELVDYGVTANGKYAVVAAKCSLTLWMNI